MTNKKENTKRKQTTKVKSKVVGYIGVPSTEDAASASENEELQRREFWNEAIAELENTQFTTLEEALYGLIDHAMKRLQMSEDAETREFLYDLLNMDPEFRKEIEGLLHITG